MKSIASIIDETKHKDRPKNLTTEFQVYGVFLAETLEDTKHYSLYIKLAKELPRNLLEEALNYTKGYYHVKNKARIFMWRLKELRKELKSDTIPPYAGSNRAKSNTQNKT